uniref:Uncharacterized protein n=1 Tax=Eutreptiella gymnastica TaxID=73025 RepID=A0A7S4CSP5_9EUGL
MMVYSMQPPQRPLHSRNGHSQATSEQTYSETATEPPPLSAPEVPSHSTRQQCDGRTTRLRAQGLYSFDCFPSGDGHGQAASKQTSPGERGGALPLLAGRVPSSPGDLLWTAYGAADGGAQGYAPQYDFLRLLPCERGAPEKRRRVVSGGQHPVRALNPCPSRWSE